MWANKLKEIIREFQSSLDDCLEEDMFSYDVMDKFKQGGIVEDKFDSKENITEDLGYAVVVEDSDN